MQTINETTEQLFFHLESDDIRQERERIQEQIRKDEERKRQDEIDRSTVLYKTSLLFPVSVWEEIISRATDGRDEDYVISSLIQSALLNEKYPRIPESDFVGAVK